MDLSDDIDAKTRSINKFYTRIRLHLDDLVLPEPERAKPVTEKLKNFKEENKYGLVKPSEFELFIAAYQKEPNKPVKCDRLEATSLNKLLFSKPGFHNASSTAYLIEDLRINDIKRNSFLGGHSTYETKRENSLDHIRGCQQTMHIAKRSKEILDEMDRTALDEVREVDVQALVRFDYRNGDTLAVQGRFAFLKRSFDEAVKYFKRALESNTSHTVLVKHYMSIALFEIGLRSFVGRNFQDAWKYFQEALVHDPEHQSAKHHLELCSQQMINHQARPFGYQDSYRPFSQRRK